MELTETQAYLVLNALPNIGPVNLRRLLDAFEEDPRNILNASARELEQVQGVGPKISGTLTAWEAAFDLANEEARIARAKARFVTCRDTTYPPLLLETYDPPIGLYQRGDYTFDRPAIAMVGSRKTTLYGQKVARTLAMELTQAGFCIVSGLARGIDTAAHEGALAAKGPTVGVLGTGMDIIYPPENLDLYRHVVAGGGAVVSEFPFGRRADRQSFAMRNRIVAGMAVGVIVVESDKAGGSMITARFAGEQGRQLFAVPGRIDQPTSAGCHQLIRDGASLVTCVDDILAEFSYLDGLAPTPIATKPTDGPAEPGPPMSADEAKVLVCFAGGARLVADEISAMAQLPISEVTTALMMLELQRRIAKQPDGRFEAV